VVTDDAVLARPGLPVAMEGLLGAGAAVHLRGRTTSDTRIRALVRAVGDAREAGALLVNARPALAGALGLGLHLPEGAPGVGPGRGGLGAGALLGRSVHGELPPHDAGELDYLLVGTLFPTPSHPGRPGAGIDRIRRLRGAVPSLPLVGIGGMTPERAAAVVAAGGWGAAVLRGAWDRDDPVAAAREFLNAMEQADDGCDGER
jgi:thiamine-phosphate diphosphorylase